jgi:hypothetical protein
MIIPKNAEFELYGRYFKTHWKGEKPYVLAWSSHEWVSSTVSYNELKSKGIRCSIRTSNKAA